jgi:hypothetical protein
MRRSLGLFLLALLVGLVASADVPARPATTKLETISYADLGKLVRANKGKVVVVYFWAEF